MAELVGSATVVDVWAHGRTARGQGRSDHRGGPRAGLIRQQSGWGADGHLGPSDVLSARLRGANTVVSLEPSSTSCAARGCRGVAPRPPARGVTQDSACCDGFPVRGWSRYATEPLT